jgi:hypothetical protein
MTTVISMHRTKRFLVLALLASLTLGPNLLSGNLLATVHAKGKGSRGKQEPKPNKVASDLGDLLSSKSSDSLVKVILQLNDKPSGQLNACWQPTASRSETFRQPELFCPRTTR